MAIRRQVGQIQTDDRGVRYWNLEDGGKQYLAPTYGEGTEGMSPGEAFLKQKENRRNSPEYRDSSLLKGEQKWDPSTGEWKQGTNWNNIALMGAGGLIAAPAILGAVGGAGGASMPALSAPSGVLPSGSAGILGGSGSGLVASSTVPNIGTLAGIGSKTLGGSNMLGGLGGILGKMKAMGLDPTTLGLGALSLFGGDGGDDQRTSFKGTSVDPVKMLTEALAATRALGNERRQAGPFRQRRAPEPVQIGGQPPLQIGGGLGMDPALQGMNRMGSMDQMAGGMEQVQPERPKKAVQRRGM